MKPTDRLDGIYILPSSRNEIYGNRIIAPREELPEPRAWKRAWNWLVAAIRRELIG